MQVQSNKLNFDGQKFYVGIDVHLKSWNVTILSEHVHHKTFNQPPDASLLVSYLQKNFPGGIFYSAYEAGFSGFGIHYELLGLHVNNIVINPADVPGTQKEKLQKTDAVDSRKIARSLRNGELTGIYIPDVATQEARSLLRTRRTIVKDLTRSKQRVKSMLYYYGICLPDSLAKSSSHWSKRFIEWLDKEVAFSTKYGKVSLDILIQTVKNQRALLLTTIREIRELSNKEIYKENLDLIRSVPGIGLITGMTLLTELNDISRFNNSDKLAGYIGLIPVSHSSGERDIKGEMTFRGKSLLKTMIMESSWIAVRRDPALLLKYAELNQRMEKNKAIVRIARKILNRIYYVLKNKKTYEVSVVK